MLIKTNGVRAKKRQSRNTKPESREKIYINQWTPSKTVILACMRQRNECPRSERPAIIEPMS